MKKINLSLLHLAIAVVTLMLSMLKGQSVGSYRKSLRIIPYRLVPSYDVYCQIKIEIVEGYGWDDLHKPQREETMEIIMDRIVFQETSQWLVVKCFT